jgi:hypothetical protein
MAENNKAQSIGISFINALLRKKPDPPAPVAEPVETAEPLDKTRYRTVCGINDPESYAELHSEHIRIVGDHRLAKFEDPDESSEEEVQDLPHASMRVKAVRGRNTNISMPVPNNSPVESQPAPSQPAPSQPAPQDPPVITSLALLSDIEKYIYDIIPKQDTRFYDRYKLLKECIETGYKDAVEKFMLVYREILAYDTKHVSNIIRADLVSMRHTDLLISAISNKQFDILLLLLNRTVSKAPPRQSSLDYDSDSESDYRLSYSYNVSDEINETTNTIPIRIEYKKITNYLTSNADKLGDDASKFKNLMYIVKRGRFVNLCFCKKALHEFNCMYNPIDCQRCWSYLMCKIADPVQYGAIDGLNYMFSKHGHLMPKDAINIQSHSYPEQFVKLIDIIKECDADAAKRRAEYIAKYENRRQPGVEYYDV